MIDFPVSGPADIQNPDREWQVYDLMGTVAQRHLERQNGDSLDYAANGQSELPISLLQDISEALFGFVYDFSHLQQNPNFSTGSPDTLLPIGGHGIGKIARIDESTLDYQNGLITVDADYYTANPGEASRAIDRKRYTFRYFPENEICPYQLVSVEVIGMPEQLVLDNGPTEGDSIGIVQPGYYMEETKHVVVDADGGLRMRTGPGTEYGVVQLIPDGTELSGNGVPTDAPEFRWLFVTYNGQSGWVSADYLRYRN